MGTRSAQVGRRPAATKTCTYMQNGEAECHGAQYIIVFFHPSQENFPAASSVDRFRNL